MKKEGKINKCDKLQNENKDLKEELAILSNIKIIKQLNNALEDLKQGRYVIK